MVENYLRQSPLAHLGLEGCAATDRGEAGIGMAERPFPAIVNLRGKPEDKAFLAAAKEILGFDLPETPNSVAGKDGLTAFWLSPEEWWVIADEGGGFEAENTLADKLRAALADVHCAVTGVGESRTCIRISGPKAQDLLAKGCPLDLDPRALGPGAFGGAGRCAQSHVAKTLIVLHLVTDDEAEGMCLDIYVLRSFAEYLWSWLEDAAREYGLTVLAA